MRRAFGDAMISLGAVLLLLMMLVTIDPRVREQVSGTWGGPGSPRVATISSQVREVTSVVVTAARDHSIDNAPLMIFALAATVLVLFMLRT
jgi:hypothetical protein